MPNEKQVRSIMKHILGVFFSLHRGSLWRAYTYGRTS